MFRILASTTLLTFALSGSLRAQAPKPATPDPKAMYEDIEILRRILVKDLGSRSGPSEVDSYTHAAEDSVRRGLDWLRQNQYAEASQHFYRVQSTAFGSDGSRLGALTRTTPATMEGAYLKGHGVTYSLAVNGSERTFFDPTTRATGLMSICIKCHIAESVERFLTPNVPSRAPPKVTEWEKARREVKGEKDPQPSIASTFQMQSVCAPGSLTEKILKVLAENGHHFQQLPAAEHITVVITFGLPPAESVDVTRKLPSRPAVLRNAEKHIESGDSHLKAQNYAEAISGYAEAIKVLEADPIAIPQATPYETVRQFIDEAQKLLRGCYTRQAQALLASGKTAEARAALTKAETAVVKVNLPKEKPEPKVSPNLPAKLLISVTKKSLDQLHEGKQTLDQFRKEAEVQAINLPAAEKKMP